MTSECWNEQFIQRATAHSDQNKEISKDFFLKLKNSFDDLFKKSESIIEIGCGTGELSRAISDRYGKQVLGTDLSLTGIEFADKNYANNLTAFKALDVLNDSISDVYDLAICSNVLEHFRYPHIVILKILQICKYFIILVPYNQPAVDRYGNEGGVGHVFQFMDNSFDQYNIIDSFIFQTNGWQHSSCGEPPLQISVAMH